MNKIDILLKEKNIIIPNAPTPAANYVPYVITNNLIYNVNKSISPIFLNF